MADKEDLLKALALTKDMYNRLDQHEVAEIEGRFERALERAKRLLEDLD